MLRKTMRCSALMTLMLVLPSWAKPPAAEAMVVPSVQLQFTPPQGWHLNAPELSEENLKTLRPSNPALGKLLKRRDAIPRLIFTRRPKEEPGLNATLQVHEAKASMTALEALRATLGQMSALEGFKVIEEPRAFPLKGRDAAFARVAFALTKEGTTLHVEARSLLVSHQGQVVSFGFSGATEGEERAEAEFQEFLASVKLLEKK